MRTLRKDSHAIALCFCVDNKHIHNRILSQYAI